MFNYMNCKALISFLADSTEFVRRRGEALEIVKESDTVEAVEDFLYSEGLLFPCEFIQEERDYDFRRLLKFKFRNQDGTYEPSWMTYTVGFRIEILDDRSEYIIRATVGAGYKYYNKI